MKAAIRRGMLRCSTEVFGCRTLLRMICGAAPDIEKISLVMRFTAIRFVKPWRWRNEQPMGVCFHDPHCTVLISPNFLRARRGIREAILGENLQQLYQESIAKRFVRPFDIANLYAFTR